MKSSLQEYCELLAYRGLEYTMQNAELFIDIVNQTNENKAVSTENVDMVIKIFSFLNWAYANGVWSNLENATLRRDLITESMNSIVLLMADVLSKDKSKKGIASFAVNFDKEFRNLAMVYKERIGELAREGIAPDANTATIVCLEWLQEVLEINDEDMNIIVHRFGNRVDNIAEIEQIANQVLHKERQKQKSFLSRLFGF